MLKIPLKIRLLHGVFIIIIFLISLVIYNFITTYQNFLKYEEEKISIYTHFLVNNIEKAVNTYLENNETSSYEQFEQNANTYSFITKNIIEPDFFDWQVIITNKKGILLYHSHQLINPDKPEDFSTDPAVKSGLLGNWGLKILKINNKYYYTSSKFVSGVEWLVVIQIPTKNVLINAFKILIPNIILIIPMLIIGIFLSIYWIKRIINPLSAITSALNQYSTSDSYTPIDKYLLGIENKKDPITAAIDSFNRMIEERKNMEMELMEIDENERKKIGMNLYNDVSRFLNDLNFKIQLLQKEMKTPNSEILSTSYYNEVSNLISMIIKKIRNITIGLCPVSLYEQNLFKAVKELANNLETTYNIHCKFTYGQDIYLKNNLISINLYRIILEAANNAIVHAKAKKIEIDISKHHLNIITTIKDDGVGFNPENTIGIGIKSMKYRAKLIDAKLEITSKINEGTSITCIINIIKIK